MLDADKVGFISKSLITYAFLAVFAGKTSILWDVKS